MWIGHCLLCLPPQPLHLRPKLTRSFGQQAGIILSTFRRPLFDLAGSFVVVAMTIIWLLVHVFILCFLVTFELDSAKAEWWIFIISFILYWRYFWKILLRCLIWGGGRKRVFFGPNLNCLLYFCWGLFLAYLIFRLGNIFILGLDFFNQRFNLIDSFILLIKYTLRLEFIQ